MASSMKTTIDIAPALLEQAKRRAGAEGTTLRALVEAGLRRILDEAEAEPYVYEPVTIDLNPPPGVDLDDPSVIKAIARGYYDFDRR